MREDALSDALRMMRLKSCVYFLRDFAPPWGFAIPKGPFAQFHVVVRGGCSLEHEGAICTLQTGDVVLFVRGDAHVLSDKPGGPVVEASVVMDNAEAFAGAPAQASATLLCGHFELDAPARHCLRDQLPAVIHVRAYDITRTGAASSIVPSLVGELINEQPGSRAVVESLAEALLVETLRAHAAVHARPHGFLAAARDRRLSRALVHMHTHWNRPLALSELASAAGVSRSVLANRFQAVVGQTPMAYLAAWRMLQAHRMLVDTDLPIAEIGRRVGYGSDVAFSRAFKRETGANPSAVRAAQAASAAGSPQSC